MTVLPLPIPDATPAGQIPRGCRWIDGDPVRDADWSYCQKHRVRLGCWWCAEHRALAYRIIETLREEQRARAHAGKVSALSFGSVA